MVADPLHRESQVVLVAARGHHVKDHIGADELLNTAPVGGVGVEDVPDGVPVKDADARRLLAGELLHRVVVVHFALRHLVLRERNVEVRVEIAVV